ncbi:MAG: homoserine dehydrogenase [Chthoniobacterales bacterium]
MKTIGIGLAGFGTVGAGVFDNLEQQRDLLAERTGFVFDVRKIAVRGVKKHREVFQKKYTQAAAENLFTTSWRDLLTDPEIKIIVELIGGTSDAYELIKAAIESGRMVVTGNKALLAEHGKEIFSLAAKHGLPVFYEAAVAGGIPIIQSLRDGYVGNHIESMHGILHGTTNYILSRMQAAGLDYKAALLEATKLGYAEADPTLDVNGWDAAHKAIILAALAYGFWVPPEALRVEGIERVTESDIKFARDMGYVIKLVASIHATPEGNIRLLSKLASADEVQEAHGVEKSEHIGICDASSTRATQQFPVEVEFGKNSIDIGVAPTLIPEKSVLASVSGVFNAIALKADLVGDALFYGRGAGRNPTASSVIADLVEAAKNLPSPQHATSFASHALYGNYSAANDIVSCYYLRLAVEDRPGVLATIAGLLGEAGVGISSVMQPESSDGLKTSLVFMTHEAAYGTLRVALEKISALSCVKGESVLFNVSKG